MTDPATTPSPEPTSPGWAVARYIAGLAAAGTAVKLILAIERIGIAALVPSPTLAQWLFRDGVVALVGGVALGLVSRIPRVGEPVARTLLGLSALYLGLNVAFFRSFSTPLNRGLLNMAGGVGDLGESFLTQVTPNNAWPVIVAVASALLAVWVAKHWRRAVGALTCILLAYAIVLGAIGLDSQDARGLERNALWELALLPVPQPDVVAITGGDDTRIAEAAPLTSLVEPGALGPDLSSLRGAAADMNVIYVVLESTSAQYLGLYGAQDDPMPNLSRMAEHALVFDSWYSVTPASMKSLFATLCSTWPYPRPIADTYVHPRLPCHSLSEVLSLGGYRSSLVHSGKFSYTRKDAFLEGRGFDSLWDKNSLPSDDDAYSDSWGLEEEAAVAQMERFLDEGGSKPFFLMYLPIFPHYPYHLPPDETPRFGDDSNQDKYLSAMAYADRNLGALYDAVAERGLLDSTLFIVVGDHGEAFGQHPGNRIHSIHIHEENVHVPALWSNPVLFPETRRVDTPADHTAMAPSLLDLMGRPAPDRWQGHSVLDGERHMAHFFTDYSFLFLGLRDGPYKVIHNVQSDTTQLYDVSQDPAETHDIAAENPELVARYAAHLDHWYVRQLAVFSDYDAYVAGSLADTGRTSLQDLVPVQVDHGEQKTRFGVAAKRRELSIAGTTYSKGIGMWADSLLRYDLDGEYTRVHGFVGHDDQSRRGAAHAEIWLDGNRAFDSGPLTHGSPAVPFDLDLTDVQTLEFKVLQGDDGTNGDAVDWVDTVFE